MSDHPPLCGCIVCQRRDAEAAGYRRGVEDAARIADRNDKSAWGIAREIRSLAPSPAPGAATETKEEP